MFFVKRWAGYHCGFLRRNSKKETQAFQVRNGRGWNSGHKTLPRIVAASAVGREGGRWDAEEGKWKTGSAGIFWGKRSYVGIEIRRMVWQGTLYRREAWEV